MDQWLQQAEWIDHLSVNWKDISAVNQKKQVEKLEEFSQSIFDFWTEIEEQLYLLKDQLKPEAFPCDYRSKGTIYFQLDMFPQACEQLQLEKAVGEEEGLRILYLAYSFLYCQQLNKAKEHFLYALSFFKSDHHVEITHFCYIGLGCIMVKLEKYDEGIHFFEKANEWLTDNDDVVYNLGICHFLNQSYEHARFYFEKAIENNDQDGEAYYFLGCSLLQCDQRNEGFKAFGHAFHLLKSSEMIIALAYLLEWNGLFKEAIACYKKLLPYEKWKQHSLHGVAWNYGLLNHVDKSLEYFQQLFKVNPTHQAGKHSVEWLNHVWSGS
ncbi:tetratricopeptide repeat protein [Alkalihalobacillus trypoxylicola]|uniref:Uncharacterized protein n=1 Tax=Alkalihalobacillus trypoxylicola TaxID=519424 RepID=A0A162EHC7_9BACI|nr:hypothetical protein [Alkalihalobacillus trypoxylicola]KYG32890.1 hypothetical protein AZF04_18195 [Alkalihalobacillus trypoxylicola]